LRRLIGDGGDGGDRYTPEKLTVRLTGARRRTELAALDSRVFSIGL